MPSHTEYRKKIIEHLEYLGLRYGHEAAFRDWCEMLALSIQNSCTLEHSKKWEAREKSYIEITGKYQKDELPRFAEMSAYLVEIFEFEPFQDALGQIYMEFFTSRTKTKTLGQCFTPQDVAFACAKMTIDESQDLSKYSYTNPLTIMDPAVGGGVMPIGGLKALHELGFDWQRKCVVHCGDIDKLCVHMAYIQLSLIGARAFVKHQDAITMQCWDELYTPMEIFWVGTLRKAQPEQQPETQETPCNETCEEPPQISPTFNEKEKDVQTPTPEPEPAKTPRKAPKQLTLF